MHIKFAHLLAVAVLMTAVHFTAIRVGWYEGGVLVDMPLHFLGGILAGMTWLWVMPYLSLGASNRLATALGAVALATLGSFLWELLEFGFSTLFPEYALPLKLYSSTVSDVLSDVALGILGGIALALVYLRRSPAGRKAGQ